MPPVMQKKSQQTLVFFLPAATIVVSVTCSHTGV